MRKLMCLVCLVPLTGCLSVGFHFGGTYSMPGPQTMSVKEAPTTQPVLPRENNTLPRTTDVLDSLIYDLLSGEPRAN